MRFGIGIDIGGTKTAVVFAFKEHKDDVYRIRKRVQYDTALVTLNMYPFNLLDEILKLIKEYIDENGIAFSDIDGIGISCGGPLDTVAGIILSPPNLPGWDNIHITEYFENNTGIRTHIQNDANACALAEWKYGAGRGTGSMVFMTFGTGLGAGIVIDGHIYEGACGMAGEIGHVRCSVYGPVGYGKSGSFEGFCSGGGIAQIARDKIKEYTDSGRVELLRKEYIDNGSPSAKTVAMLASEKDELSMDIMRISAQKLGFCVSILIDILNPEAIVIGSIYARNESFMYPYVMDIVNKEALSISAKACRLLPSSLGDSIGDYAALAVI